MLLAGHASRIHSVIGSTYQIFCLCVPHSMCSQPMCWKTLNNVGGSLQYAAHIFLQSSHRVSAIIAEMLCLCCPQQRSSKKTQRAGTSTGAAPCPHLPFSFATPHFGVPQLHPSCMGGWQPPVSIALLHSPDGHHLHPAHLHQNFGNLCVRMCTIHNDYPLQ
jgi:hypothetical protein